MDPKEKVYAGAVRNLFLKCHSGTFWERTFPHQPAQACWEGVLDEVLNGLWGLLQSRHSTGPSECGAGFRLCQDVPKVLGASRQR